MAIGLKATEGIPLADGVDVVEHVVYIELPGTDFLREVVSICWAPGIKFGERFGPRIQKQGTEGLFGFFEAFISRERLKFDPSNIRQRPTHGLVFLVGMLTMIGKLQWQEYYAHGSVAIQACDSHR